MYSLDINFLKDRPEYQPKVKRKITIAFPTGNLTPAYLGVSLGVFFPLLAGLSLWFLQAKNSEMEQNIARLEQEKQQLDQQIGNINKIKEETNTIKRETQALVTVFDQIRPWSAMLQDLRDRIPSTVQIEEIKQTPPTTPDKNQPPPNPAGGVEIVGFARSFNDVNDFLLSMQQSRFLKSTETKIITSELVDAPSSQGGIRSITGIPIKPPQIVKYTIQSTLSDVPASELIRELEQKGTVGLVARLRSLQQTGVLKK
ncbi:PilN domain-containing protein [Aetokthonos hydrillicola Thurmond2011]|jgi:type IV pilus assembly protein PilN|uniref:PilN domain-containing protein n=1 Tax=Aetokthonos hydrillicola Thurmond2011 TaxID=2712845 RepID=A0AAP5I5C2_9CYAN|nr:PilN domain-containing protein [Aetokthonos hydrillicola]MBW4588083.1 PilN domain-containing protein [Aetokthonos hydrillicola CCALA 1050]MDR9893398.1 PilN domain-containing protein [Aetokthonos hydrillicola Thurmond2011]